MTSQNEFVKMMVHNMPFKLPSIKGWTPSIKMTGQKFRNAWHWNAQNVFLYILTVLLSWSLTFDFTLISSSDVKKQNSTARTLGIKLK